MQARSEGGSSMGSIEPRRTPLVSRNQKMLHKNVRMQKNVFAATGGV